ncbi:hypothetical protein POVWA2_075710 [Plasmodium ovale wallikeri]|uniref:Uncharacterized protein n=1 Tax=Plasmodium ovale wallikeri TaxID=864142 RepID=A0A1A8YLY2_PLAOA|nr:hypothetical protein POVWA1_012590 [Plasmodium ovale wallikeri]SBT56857.1 hypothetical protein POVWA2_075710 [Plasmodium ovale wallikeri]
MHGGEENFCDDSGRGRFICVVKNIWGSVGHVYVILYGDFKTFITTIMVFLWFKKKKKKKGLSSPSLIYLSQCLDPPDWEVSSWVGTQKRADFTRFQMTFSYYLKNNFFLPI